MAKTKNILIRYPRLTLITIAIVAVAVAIVTLGRCSRHNELHVETERGIALTPEIVTSLKGIGQWEFLSINDEELVDTIRKGFFSDDHLARIDYGTLRLGIDMGKTQEGWIVSKGDSVSVTLPPIELLDSNFIDEALTKPFIEKGKWTDADRQQLYVKACRQMRKRCMSRTNIQSAENNATRQFNQMLEQMGFNKIRIRIKDNANERNENLLSHCRVQLILCKEK